MGTTHHPNPGSRLLDRHPFLPVVPSHCWLRGHVSRVLGASAKSL